MTSRERVLCVINHGTPDRVPVYGWVKANLTPQIAERWGSVEAFEDAYEFDLAHLFGGPSTWLPEHIQALHAQPGGIASPELLLDVPTTDPDDVSAYANLLPQIAHHKTQRGRWIYVQTPGIFEALNGVFGIENHLAFLAEYPDELDAVYAKQAQWNRRFAMNCLDLGIDMIHVSDDWGAQAGLMFSPRQWARLIAPHHRTTTEAVRQRGGYLSLHSDGNVLSVVDGVIDLGYHVLHPWQESAGMDLAILHNQYAGRLVGMGGLDVQTTIGFGRIDALRADIERVLGMFRSGGLLYCTSHFIQDHCTVDELTLAFDLIRDTVRAQAH